MSVSGFSVSHDVEVQQYRRMRAAYLAETKAQKSLEKDRRRLQKETSVSGKSCVEQSKGGLLSRFLRSRSEKTLKDTGTKREATKGKVEADDGWSDAETEVDLIDILKDGEGDEMNVRTEKAPPYVFLGSMAGVTAPLGRWG